MVKKKQLCACGCGGYAKPGNKYINGHNRRGYKHTTKTKAKMLEAWKTRLPVTDETKAKLSKIAKNRPPVSDETKVKMSEAAKNMSNETKAKMSEAAKNRAPHSDKTRQKMSKSAKNKPPITDETRTKLKGARKNRLPITDETRTKMSKSQKNRPPVTDEARKHRSAGHQGIAYDEWESFVSKSPYCPDFNEKCKESNREKYDRCCFLTGLPEEENITSTGKHRKLSVHHVDMDKMQGCNDIRWKLIPVCIEWHNKIHNKLWEARIIWLLNNVWA